ncbi:hypothetical protein HWG63_13230 [Staphylococcus aureus]|uniref:hypothetical protein n=1 Tax=Staphylococcus aureus TaxID=1280 RepID=UPI001CC58D86|nr:hypothetical protein [Staphylococcus aureus]MBZ5292663.1 hypothetical protein [Staphylococcus aureus]UXT64001.1 hypothetical protein MUA94_13795 [Staphylococcus aureus]HDM8570513.1 hypothetical protein [Staphylococcus aureus]HDM8622210.1 hypothetical protein [Staphylococcus aureus]
MNKITKDDLKQLTQSQTSPRTHPTVAAVSAVICLPATVLVPTSKCASVTRPCNK